jgi:indolepyruvate ferredoxin oxidoreductase
MRIDELPHVSLDDKYTATGGTILLTGTQALVRLPMDQRRRDRQAGLDTGGYISGYRGTRLRVLTNRSVSNLPD